MFCKLFSLPFAVFTRRIVSSIANIEFALKILINQLDSRFPLIIDYRIGVAYCERNHLINECGYLDLSFS